jgi:hypothetical protein
MKWAFAIQSKIRLAILLAILMLFIILFSLVESYNMTRISRSFNSIYKDRLVPAVDLYSIADHIHSKRDYIITYLFTDKMNAEEIRNLLNQENSALDTLIKKYENTYLVKDEANHLISLKKNINNYRQDEISLIQVAERNKEEAVNIYLNTSVNVFQQLNRDLRQLIKVQTDVGSELMKESQNSQSSSGFVSRLQFVIAIILGLMILILVITDKQVNIKQEKYKLN